MKITTMKYLQGSEYNNYLGTIIGIHKFKLNANPVSILLYFDQRTGKIERFLVNSKEQINYLSIKNDTDQKILNTYKTWYKVSEDGKLDGKFLSFFLIELLSDFFRTNKSYKICDMNYIRNLNISMENYSESNYKNNESNIAFTNKRYINLNYDKLITLNVPQYMNIQTIKNILESSYNIKIQTYVINNESPKALIDLKVQFNARTISNIQELNDKINEFNIQCEDRLIRMKSSIKEVKYW